MPNESPPASKRFRVDKSEKNDTQLTSLIQIISPNVFTNVESISESYSKASPYPHGVVSDIFVDGFLENIREELKKNSKVKFKESDLFRVYQSIDLGNLEPTREDLSQEMPCVMALRKAIYSPQYRSFMERICNLEPGTLTEQIDCAVNCHVQGCHLLCHDDVIGTRKVSYIFYLTDPEPRWTEEDGGRLELYESVVEDNLVGQNLVVSDENHTHPNSMIQRRVPTVIPIKTILPIFNTMAYFVVKPGFSFHAVQEVFCDRPRLAIQGWYHAKEIPENIENSTLNRLKSMGYGEDTDGIFFEFEKDNQASTELSRRDIAFLSQFINNTYLEDSSIGSIRQRFEDESSVQLRHFFKEAWASKIKLAASSSDEKQKLGKKRIVLDYSVGIGENWKAVGPSHKQRFLEYIGEADSNSTEPGALLLYLKQHVLQSAAFGRFIASLTSLSTPNGFRGRVRRFRPGFDYTVAHHGILTRDCVLDATICFVEGTGNQCQYDAETGDLIGTDDDALWDSGDYGGFEVYISAEDDSKREAEDEYKDDDDTELLSVSASSNTLSLVYRDPGTMRFVKYVGCGAPGSRWDITMEYQVDIEDETSGSKDDEGESDE